MWSPLAQGILTGKYLPGQPAPEGSRAADDRVNGFVKGWFSDELLTAVQEIKPIAADHGLSLSQFAVAWVLQNDNVSSAIIGASRPEQVHENAKASGIKLDADVMAKVDDILAPFIKRDPKLTRSPKPRA